MFHQTQGLVKNHSCFLEQEKNCTRTKKRSTTFLAIAIMITLLTNRCRTENSLLWWEILVILLSVPQLLKLLRKYFPPAQVH